MKTIVSTLNSKFIHSSLAIRYLKSFCEDKIPNINIDICEFTINQNTDYITGEIFKKQPDVVAFSCYIWNIENTLDICKRLKIVDSDIKIILGGPEVSFDGQQLMKKYSFIDFIIYGEGEITFNELMKKVLLKDDNYKDVKGLIYKKENKIIKNIERPLIKNLDIIPSPYDSCLDKFKNRIVYFESSRGCPFNCKFCLSSTIKGIRFFSIDRIKKDLEKLIKAQVKQVKFVDRTFNAKKEHAMEIIKFIMDKNPHNINFHFEITAHILDDDILDLLSHAKEGLFQFEIGVQSTNLETIKASGRVTKLSKLKKVVTKIKSFRNIHQHLDLIAGLPCEDYNSFKNSFDEVYLLEPEKLQLGFLKLLKGSQLRDERYKYGFKFLNKPPYEVLENNCISYKEMLRLKIIEDLVEKYFNEDNFKHSLRYIVKNYYKEPFKFYEEFSIYWESKNYHSISHSKRKLYTILYEFYMNKINKNIELFKEILKFDFVCNNKSTNLPYPLKPKDIKLLQDKKHDFLKDNLNLKKYLPQFYDIPVKKIIKQVHFESFNYNIIDFANKGYNNNMEKQKTIILFDYNKIHVIDNCYAYDVTDEFKKIR